MSRSILILGATSAIGQRITLALAEPGDSVFLAGRDDDELSIIAANLRVRRDVSVELQTFEAERFETHRSFAKSVLKTIGPPDIIIVAVGALGDQLEARSNEGKILEIGASNFLGIATGTAHLIAAMEARRSGNILVLSSVAGDRGRASNYVYGAAKAGINAYFSGLRARLHKSGVRVTTVKLGFVDTQMVFGKSGKFLVADPDFVAMKIKRLIRSPKDVVYLPSFWWIIMNVIKLLPERLFKRLPL